MNRLGLSVRQQDTSGAIFHSVDLRQAGYDECLTSASGGSAVASAPVIACSDVPWARISSRRPAEFQRHADHTHHEVLGAYESTIRKYGACGGGKRGPGKGESTGPPGEIRVDEGPHHGVRRAGFLYRASMGSTDSTQAPGSRS